MTRILIADRHAVTRAGYRYILSAEPTIMHIGEAIDGEQAMSQLSTERWDLLLLDVQIVMQESPQLLGHIHSLHPTVHVLIVNGLSDPRWAAPLLKGGIAGCLSKSCSPIEVLNAVRSVLRRGRYLGEATPSSRDLSILATETLNSPHGLLSQRELQIFCQLAAGKRLSRAAEQLGISVKTASTYRQRIFEKMSLTNNAQIIHYALYRGLIPHLHGALHSARNAFPTGLPRAALF